MKNSNDNTFDPGILLSGEDSKPKVRSWADALSSASSFYLNIRISISKTYSKKETSEIIPRR
jgi:hypothetical protein